ncbi:unnamed protein product [Acanthosepion pharaonis]|uniref:Uncharacterized protein n=1 Tax=Acanthosepion pharaonis TaxID=158019 RepID=A0A812AW23_ACAPH|nr:unnamed protein product [Sepia pharaonis]
MRAKSSSRVPGANYNATITGHSTQRPHAGLVVTRGACHLLGWESCPQGFVAIKAQECITVENERTGCRAASASRASEIHHQRLLRNVRNAAATAKSRAIEILDRRHTRQSRDTAATATARAAETLLLRSVRNARNAATNARSRAAEIFDHRRARQSRDAAATAKSRESETELQRATRSPAMLQRLLLLETPRAHRQRQTDIQGLLQTLRAVTCPSSSFWFFLAFIYDPGINLITRDDINIGSMTCVCQFCNACKWAGEPAGLCCSSGKVRLPPLHEPPTPLRGLIAGSHPDSNHFLKTIKQYNNNFQMTSFGAQVVREESWMPTFKVQGQVYHRIGNLYA